MLTPRGDRILIQDPDHITTSKSGLIHIVGGDRLDVVESKVISAGVLVKDPGIKPGARVVHTRLTGVKMENFSTEGLPRGHYRIIQEREVLAILSPEAVFEGGRGAYDENGNHDLSKD
jgi:co-chaperonin GroES (HSP10)